MEKEVGQNLQGWEAQRHGWKRGRLEESERVLCRWPHSREAGGNLLLDNKFWRPVHRHVMNELLDTERVYVEELLCVLEVSLPLGVVGRGPRARLPHPVWPPVH